MVRLNRTLEQLIIKAVQEPKLQILGQKGKIDFRPISLMFVGKEAVEAAVAPNGDIKAAMKLILSRLEPPKLEKVKALAMICAVEEAETKTQAARDLGVSPTTVMWVKSSWHAIVKMLEETALPILEEEQDGCEPDEPGCVDEEPGERCTCGLLENP